MIQLPGQPTDTERALGQVYRESFTGLTVDTVTLGHEPAATADGVALVTVAVNGQTIDPTNGGVVASWARDRFTGGTSASLTLSHATWTGSPFVFKNGTLLDPNTQYTLVGTSLTLGSAPAAPDIIDARYQYTTALSYTQSGATITLSQALVATDVVTVSYHYRS